MLDLQQTQCLEYMHMTAATNALLASKPSHPGVHRTV